MISACAITTSSHLAWARVLIESFFLHNQNSKFYLLLVDGPQKEGNSEKFDGLPVEIVQISDLDIPRLNRFAFIYSPLELCCALKPKFLQYLLEVKELEKVLYFDCDIYVTGSLQHVWSTLSSCNILLSPHARSPEVDSRARQERTFLSDGIFNLGFIGVMNSADTLSFLQWWFERTREYSLKFRLKSIFLDQKWINLAVILFDGVSQLRTPGYNVAVWNLYENRVRSLEGKFHIGNFPLIFFHFSHFRPKDPKYLEFYLSFASLETRDAFASLCAQYEAALLSAGVDQPSRGEYAYARFRNGKRISVLQRKLFYLVESPYTTINPFEMTGFWGRVYWLRVLARFTITTFRQFRAVCPRLKRAFIKYFM